MSLFERHAHAAEQLGLTRIRVEDQQLDARYITVDGRRLLNFGSCAYLGLNTDPRLKRGAKSAIDAFGAVFSSSAVYTSISLYTDLEARLERIVGSPVIVATTTTLAHLATLPTVIGEADAVLVDSQAHASVHLASRVLASDGIPVISVPHNDMQALEDKLEEVSDRYRHVWYLADGIYSMFGDALPVKELERLLEKFPNLWAYVDDAHGFGWKGRFGRGWVLDLMPHHPRLILAFSLAKSWGSGGSALAFPNEQMAARVLSVGSTFTFSGPLHPAELGASVAAADIVLSEEHSQRQGALLKQIELVANAARDAGLPLMATDATPLWFVKVGSFGRAADLGQRLMKRGFYLNIGGFPAVPNRLSGLRFTNTLFHTDDQILSLIEALRTELPQVGVELDSEIEVTIDLTADDAIA